MFLFALAVMFLAGALGLVFVAARAKRARVDALKPDDERAKQRIAMIAAAGIGGLGLLILLFSTLYRQDVGEALVITTPGGEIAGIDTDPGFALKAPWNDIVSYDIRNQVITMSGDTPTEASSPAILAQTADGTAATLDLTVRYSINPTSVAGIYREYRSQENLVGRALINDVRSLVRDETVKFPTTTMRQERGQLTANIAKSLEERWEPLGVLVDSVDLRNIAYPDEIETSLKQVQTALNNVDRAKAELETSRVDAEKVKTEAQAQSDADQIIRCGATSRTVEEEINGKKVNVIKVIPVPIDECQNRLNQQVLTAKYIDMLRRAAEGGNTVYVIPQDAQTLLNLSAPTANE